jgi:hypothetical protein
MKNDLRTSIKVMMAYDITHPFGFFSVTPWQFGKLARTGSTDAFRLAGDARSVFVFHLLLEVAFPNG